MRRPIKLLATTAVASLLLGACGRCGEKPVIGKEAPRPVALVNGEPIGSEALKRELAGARTAGSEGTAFDGAVRRRLLDGAIDKVLVIQQARKRSIAIGQDQVERALLRLRAEYPGTHFDDLLAQERLSESELKQRFREQLTIEKFFASEVFPSVQVSEAEIERYYGEHAAEFEQPEQVRASQIVVRTKEEAQRIREELRRKPQAFADVARRSSIAPEGKQGGDLGWFAEESGMPEVFDVCFELSLNSLSDITPSPYGFHLFKVSGRRSAARRAFAEVRSTINDRLLREKRALAQTEYVASLRKSADIRIDSAALDAVSY